MKRSLFVCLVIFQITPSFAEYSEVGFYKRLVQEKRFSELKLIVNFYQQVESPNEPVESKIRRGLIKVLALKNLGEIQNAHAELSRIKSVIESTQGKNRNRYQESFNLVWHDLNSWALAEDQKP